MSEFLTQSELADRLMRKAGVSQEVAKKFAETFFFIVKKGLKNSDRFSVYNFGTFKKTWIEATTGRNPATGEEIKIASHWRIKFTPCSSVAKRMNRPYAHLKPKIIDEKVSDNGLYAKASKYAEKENADISSESVPENPPTNEEIEENTVQEIFDKEDDKTEIENHGKLWKIIAACALVGVLLIFLISLLVRSCSNKNNRSLTGDETTEKPKTTVERTLSEPLAASEAWREDEISETPKVEADETVSSSPLTKREATADEADFSTSVEMTFSSYDVPSGYSYNIIAEEQLKNRHLWPLIYSANKDKSVDPDFISKRFPLKVPQSENGIFSKEKIAESVLDAYNGYLFMIEKEPNSAKNELRRDRAVRVIVSGEIVNRGFIDEYSARILPEVADEARKIVSKL